MADIKSKLSSKALGQLVNAPKRKIYEKIAEKLGIKTTDSDEQTAMDIAQATADKLGWAQNSLASDVGKTAIATGLEFFTPDATMALGPMAKVAGKAAKAYGPTAKVLEKVQQGAKTVKDSLSKAPTEEVINYGNIPGVRKPPQVKQALTDPDYMKRLSQRRQAIKVLEQKRALVPGEAKAKASMDELQKNGIIRIK